MESNTLKDNGYEVSIICPTGKGYESPYEQINGIHIYRHPLPPEQSSSLGYIREYAHALYHEFRLARKIRKERGFDVIQICNPPDVLFLVTLWFKLFFGCKVIFDHHDLNPELFEAKFNKRGFFYYALKWAEYFTFKTADLVISTNESYKKIAIERGGKKPEKVHVVRSGPDMDKFKAVPANPAYKKGRTYLVGYLGVMGEFDGIDYLVKAVEHIVHTQNRDDIHFRLVGSGPCLDQVKELSETLKVSDYIDFTGRVSDEELILSLSSCDVCANPDPVNALNDKSTMNKILEYMALSKPIVQFDVLEGRFSAQDASLYAEADNIEDFALKISGLCDAPAEEKQRMGDFGYNRMKNELAWNYQRAKLLDAYGSLNL
jgi:glycosyltransferase involved in cell wall biosynthesis